MQIGLDREKKKSQARRQRGEMGCTKAERHKKSIPGQETHMVLVKSWGQTGLGIAPALVFM